MKQRPTSTKYTIRKLYRDLVTVREVMIDDMEANIAQLQEEMRKEDRLFRVAFVQRDDHVN